jgi:hypothetical protein
LMLGIHSSHPKEIGVTMQQHSAMVDQLVTLDLLTHLLFGPSTNRPTAK